MIALVCLVLDGSVRCRTLVAFWVFKIIDDFNFAGYPALMDDCLMTLTSAGFPVGGYSFCSM